MSIENVVDASPTRDHPRAHRRQPSLRWSVVRLVLLWAPIAAVLALALWNLLFLTLDPWDHRANGPPALDAVPSQLLFTALLVIAGRVETDRQRRTDRSPTSVLALWVLSALLIAVGVSALWFMAMHQPVLQ